MENGFKHPVRMVYVKSTNVNETPCALGVLNQFRADLQICAYILIMCID